MNKLMNVSFKFLDLLVIFVMAFSAPVGVLAAPSPTGATIISDLADYNPGATVTLTGAGWIAGESVHIFVNDDAGQTWKLDSNPDPVADANGAFTYPFQLPSWFVANYSVTAGPGSLGSGTATTTFTDLSIGTYDQCSNDQGSGYTSGDTGCRWINGNLQSNNSIYFEGDATVQRLWLTDLAPGSTHTVTLKYGTTKGGKHAYDFLTRWDWSENWITDADRCQGIGGCTSLADSPGLAIPVDPNANGFDVAANLIKPRQFIMRGGTLNSATVPTIVSGSYGGDSETVITVSFNVGPSSGAMCETKQGVTTCGVALWFGAHVAAQANWGLGLGAGSISGSPYHVALDAVDGASVGQRDNQMQANVVTFIPNGTIVIIKDAQPNDAQDFSFNLQNNPLTVSQNFSLDDDSDPTLPNSKTFSVPPGAWTANELSIPTGWTLSNLACSVTGTNGSTATTDLANAKASITLKSNDTVTCTFTDTKNQGKDLKVTKTATPSFSRLYNWAIDKSVDQTTINIADGGTATFNYSVKVTPTSQTDSKWAVAGKITVANSNGFAMSGVNVTDSIDNGGTCSVTNGTNVTVPANSSVELDYSCTYASAPSADAGTNTATATWDASAYYGTSGSAAGTAGVDFSTVKPTESNNTITVVDDKTDPANPVTLGTWNWADGEHTFTYSLDKQGVAGKCTDYTNTATISETKQSDSQKVTVCVGKDLTVSKTAAGTYNRTYLWQINKVVDQTKVSIAEGGSYTFHYTVDVAQTDVSDAGWTVTGKITISNPNDWEDVILTGLTDAVDNGGTCTLDAGPYKVLAGKTLDVSYTCTYSSAPSSYSGTNTATATWDEAAAFTPSGSASGGVPFTLSQAGSTSKTVTVTDSYKGKLGTVTAKDSAPFATATFTYDRTESGVAGKCTTYNNTATITETGQSAGQSVTLCVGKDLTVTKTASGTFDRTYQWTISKAVDKTSVNIAAGGSYTFHYTVNVEQTGVTDAGWTLAGKITITNPNDWEDITLSSLTDVVDNGGNCTVANGPYIVPKGGSLDVNYSCSYATAPSSYSGTNAATVTWDKAVYFTPGDTATGSAPFTLSQAGTTNKTVHVTDSYGGSLGTVTAEDSAPFATATFTYDRTESGVAGKCTSYDNTATITETDQSASKTVTLCVGANLKVTKTASGTFDRSYQWQISKDVDKTKVSIADGGKATFNYTVDVAQTGVKDTGWILSGKITITNPNDWEAVMLSGLTDIVDNGGTCTVDPAPYIVPKNGSLDVNYTCAYSSAPSNYSGTNTATATWDKATTFTPDGSASGSAPFTLSQFGSTNKTVHVTDTFGGDLGTVTATDGPQFASATFQYSHDFAGVGGTCKDYDNTATITETGQNASKTVTVCVGLDLTVSKTASGSFDRAYLWDISKAADKTSVTIADGTSYTFHYTVNVTQTGIQDSGWEAHGVITISNPNNWENITLTGLSDAVDNGGTCTVDAGPYKVLAGKTLDVGYTCSYSGAPSSYSGINTATATWDNAAAFTPTGSATGIAGFTLAQGGSTNKTVHVTDSFGGDLGTVTATDATPFATQDFKYDRVVNGKAGTCTEYDNTATITETDQSTSNTVTLCVAKDLTVAKSAAGTFDRAYLWKISKDVNQTSVKIADGGSYTFHYTVLVEQTGVSDSGWTLSGKITIINPNDFEAITLTGLTDAVDNGGACTVDAGPYVIPASGSLDVNYSCSYGSAPSSYSGTNTATATWDKEGAHTPNGSKSGNAIFTLAQLGSTNKTVHVTDSYGGDLGTVTATNTAPYAKGTFTYDRTESGVAGTCTAYDNTATITETGDTASKQVTLCVAKDLTVTKTVVAKYDRTYKWLLDKTVDKTNITTSNSTATFNYTIKVTPNGYSDGNYRLTGAITINNPNDWEDVTLTSLSDALDQGGSCSITESAPYVVPHSGSLTVHYTCITDGTTTKNTATANWDKAAYFTPTGSAGGTQDVSFVLDNQVNKVINVVDDNATPSNTSDDRTFGPFDWSDGEQTATYTRVYDVPVAACKNYTNTAKIKETGQSDSQTVTVCRASLVTNSQLCTVPNDQWRLIFTPAVDQSQGYKLNASNPGQTYYNMFYTGPGNADIKITLPYPYVTQGATPIHVYSNVGVTTSGGVTCLTPSGELANQNDQVTLTNYTPQAMGSTYQVTVHVPALSGGFAYINIHLDYGLKGTTGYAKGGSSNNDAVSKTDTTKVLIPDLQPYTFSDTAGGSYTVTTTNVFKKNPGIGGKADKKLTDDPAPANTKVVITDANKKVVATVYTDEDGWYMWSYKYTGKATTFNITIAGITKSVTLKSNAYVEVDFELP